MSQLSAPNCGATSATIRSNCKFYCLYLVCNISDRGGSEQLTIFNMYPLTYWFDTYAGDTPRLLIKQCLTCFMCVLLEIPSGKDVSPKAVSCLRL
jgi:hypothetical protein